MATDQATRRLQDALVRVLESGRGAHELFTEDALFDLNVPSWRFQVRGSGQFVDWWHREVHGRGRAAVTRSADTVSGFVIEMAIEFRHLGQDLYARQVMLAEITNDRISELVVYCTGDWDAQTRARQVAEAPMIKG
jgi:hypothetical protein